MTQNASNHSETQKDRKTAKIPAIDADEQVKWTSVHAADIAHRLSYDYVELEPVTTIQGFERAYILHIDSGTVMQAVPDAYWDDDADHEPFRSALSIARLSEFQRLTLRIKDRFIIVGPVSSQDRFMYMTFLYAENSNFALAKARLDRVFS